MNGEAARKRAEAALKRAEARAAEARRAEAAAAHAAPDILRAAVNETNLADAAVKRARARAEAARRRASDRLTSASVAWLGGWGTPGRFGLAEAFHAAAADYCRAHGLPPETTVEEAQAHNRAAYYTA